MPLNKKNDFHRYVHMIYRPECQNIDMRDYISPNIDFYVKFIYWLVRYPRAWSGYRDFPIILNLLSRRKASLKIVITNLSIIIQYLFLNSLYTRSDILNNSFPIFYLNIWLSQYTVFDKRSSILLRWCSLCICQLYFKQTLTCLSVACGWSRFCPRLLPDGFRSATPIKMAAILLSKHLKQISTNFFIKPGHIREMISVSLYLY